MKTRSEVAGILSGCVMMGLLASAPATAVTISSGSLGLTGGNPDIQSNFLNFNFDYSIGTMDIQSAFGGAQYLLNGSSENILNSTFRIQGLATAGDAELTLEITGDLASIGGGDQALLVGDLVAMSYSGTGVFEFLFGNLSGALSSVFGAQAGVIYTDTSLAGGFAFDADASSAYTGISNTFATPVPISGSSSLLLMAASLLGMFACRRATRRDS